MIRPGWRFVGWSAVFLVAATVATGLRIAPSVESPVQRYEVACFPDGHLGKRVPIHAPLRTLVADEIARDLYARGRLYGREGNDLLLPRGAPDRPQPWYPPRSDTAENAANELEKFASSFATGLGFRQRGLPLPPAVERAAARWEANNRATLSRTPDGYLTRGAADRLPSCDLVRAVLTVADDTPEERAADALLSETRGSSR